MAAVLPWLPPTLSPGQVGALKAVFQGLASAEQQRQAFDVVCEISYNGGAHYFPGEDGRRDTDFALGRKFVGDMMKTIVKVRITKGGEHG